MKNDKTLVFDMDGTIANLYGVKNWLPLLENKNPLNSVFYLNRHEKH